MSNFITVGTYSSSIDAHLQLAILQSCGIMGFLKDDNAISINPLLNFALGGIKLQVAEQDVEEALEILNTDNHADEQELND